MVIKNGIGNRATSVGQNQNEFRMKGTFVLQNSCSSAAVEVCLTETSIYMVEYLKSGYLMNEYKQTT